MPTLYAVDVFSNISHEALDAIGGLQTLPQLVEEPKPMEGQGLLQALLEGTGRRAVICCSSA